MTAPTNSKPLSVWPLVVILIAPIHALCVGTQHINGFCYFTWYIGDLCLAVGGIGTGFYQLARLKYCFGAKISSSVFDNGYPLGLFTAMNIIGILLFLNIAIFLFFCPSCPRTECALNEKGEFHVEYVQLMNIEYSTIWRHIYLVVYLLWDVVTLSLYVSKIRALTANLKAMPDNEQSLQSIKSVLNQLHKIMICTLFYELVGVTVFFVRNWAPSAWQEVIHNVVELPVAMSYSYACYLMMDHNEAAYSSFLKVVAFCKLNYLCCCYRRVVTDTVLRVQTKAIDPAKHVDQEPPDTVEEGTVSGGIVRGGTVSGGIVGGHGEEEITRTTTSDLKRYCKENGRFFDLHPKYRSDHRTAGNPTS